MDKLTQLGKKIKSVSVKTNMNNSHVKGLAKSVARLMEMLNQHENRMFSIESREKATRGYLEETGIFDDEMVLKFDKSFDDMDKRINQVEASVKALSIAYISGAICFFVYLVV